jgi:hypothetical protein
LTVNARGKRVTFGQVDEDDWEYGLLSFDGKDLRVMTSTTMDDAHNYGTPREGHMTSRHLNEIKDDEIVTKLASPDSISSIWNAVEEQVNEMLGEAKSSAKLLSEFSDVQSESIHRQLVDLMNGDYFEKQWVKARLAIDTDASDSLTRTNQFLESVCRHYLEKRNIKAGKTKTISELINAVSNDLPPLKLPTGEDHTADIKSFVVGLRVFPKRPGL